MTSIKRDEAPERAVAESEWRQGWRPAVAAAVGWGTTGVMLTNTASLFLGPVMVETGWTSSQALLTPIMGVVMAIAAPFVGKAVHHFGPKKVTLVGTLGLAAVMFAFIALPLSLPVYYGFGVLAGIFASLVAMVPWNRTVVAWFRKSAGKALSLMGLTAGVSVAILSPILVSLIGSAGWRAGYALIAGLFIVVTLPTILWGIKIRPSATPEVDTAEAVAETLVAPEAVELAAHEEKASTPVITTITGALRNKDVWALGLAFAFMVVPVGGFMANMFPVLSEGGLDPASAATILSMFFIAAALGRVVSGLMLDVMPRYYVAFIFMALAAVGSLLLGLTQPLSFGVALVAIIAFAAVAGGEIEMMGYFILRELGEKSFAVAFAVIVFIFSVCSIGAPYIFSIIKDTTGSYSGALMVATVILVVGIGVFAWRAAAIRNRLPLGVVKDHD